MTRAEVDAAWRAYDEAHGRDTSHTPTRNITPTLWLTNPVRIPYRGRMYEIPPVPYTLGVRTIELLRAMGEAQEAQDLSVYASLLREASGLAREGMRPYRPGLWTRVKWACGWNPFRRASEYELGEVLAGFVMRRTMPPAQSSGAAGHGYGIGSMN
jgi:hypothetical protein